MLEEKISNYTTKGHGKTESGIAIPRAIPGETVAFERRKKKKGRLIKVLKKSPERVRPKCRHFSSCGGCSLQHLSEAAQRSYKQHQVQALFPDQAIEPLVTIDPSYNYRNKMEFSFSKEGLGLIPLDGRFASDITKCQIVQPWMMKALDVTRKWWKETGYLSYWPLKDLGTLRHLMLREGSHTGDKMAVLCVSGRAEYAIAKKDLDLFVEVMSDAFDRKISLFLHVWQQIEKKPTQHFHWHLRGADHITETIQSGARSLLCKIGPQGFFQPATKGAELIIHHLRQIVQPLQRNLLLDLYCGSGLLSMALSDLFTKVIAVELCKESILDGKDNLQWNHIKNMELIQQDVSHFLKKEAKADVILLDPPRSGLDPKVLSQMTAKHILYVSCNPKTQARDVDLFHELGFTTQKIQPVDQFPHTPHIENIVHLSK